MNTYDLEVRVNGKSVTKYYHRGHIFVSGKDKSTYTLRFKNNSPNRVLAVTSVDGLSVIDGEPASFDSHGYVVEPFSMVDIKGWRLNNDEVAKFVFGKKSSSYAAKSGDVSNAGTFGAAVFLEKDYSGWSGVPSWPIWVDTTKAGSSIRYVYNTDTVTSNTINTCYVASDPNTVAYEEYPTPCSGSMGTEFGGSEINRVNMVSFDRANTPVEVIEIHYDSMEELVRKGIVVKRPAANIAHPFPAEKSLGFCKPPKGWNRNVH